MPALPRGNRRPEGLVEFFAQSPLVGIGLDVKRKPDYGRRVKL